MEWQDEGVILGVRRHGETSAIVEVMTPALPVVVLAQGIDTLPDMRLRSAEDTALRTVTSSDTVSAGARVEGLSTELVVILVSVASMPMPMQPLSSNGAATAAANFTAAATEAFWPP